MKKWEYFGTSLSQLIGHGNEHTIYRKEEVDKALNDIGEKGWELVSVTTREDSLYKFLYFKREKQ